MRNKLGYTDIEHIGFMEHVVFNGYENSKVTISYEPFKPCRKNRSITNLAKKLIPINNNQL